METTHLKWFRQNKSVLACMSEKSRDSFGFGLRLIKLSNSIVEEEKKAFSSASLGSPAGANKLD